MRISKETCTILWFIERNVHHISDYRKKHALKFVLSKENQNIETKIEISKETCTILKNIEANVHHFEGYRKKHAPF